MIKKYLVLIITVIVILGAIGFFYPKIVEGPLCGPVCSGIGLHSWKRDCLGFKQWHSCPRMGIKDFLTEWISGSKNTCLDTYAMYCFGLPINEKKCYGVPYTDTAAGNSEDIEIGCEYPCNDEKIKNMCQAQESLIFGSITFDCSKLKEKCSW